MSWVEVSHGKEQRGQYHCGSAECDHENAWEENYFDGMEELDGKLSFWIGEESNNFVYDDFKIINVRSSFGKKQKRYSVKLKMKLGNELYEVFVSLSDRKKMKFPCLVGRRFLYKHGFLVDVRKKNLHDRNKKK